MFYRFLIPSLSTTFFLSLSNIVDALVIGRRMQESGLAAISLTLPVFMIYNMLDVGLSTGGAMTYAQLLGIGEVKKARMHFTQVLMTALLLSLPFVLIGLLFTGPAVRLLGAPADGGSIYRFAFEYTQILLLAAPVFFMNMVLYEFIRVDGGEVLASAGFIAGTVADCVLNFVLVLGLNLGVRGAILATVIGHTLSVLIYLLHFFRPDHILRFAGGPADLKQLFASFRVGLAGSSKYLLQFVFLLSANRLLMHSYGALGVAVFDLLLNINYVASSLFDGCLSTMQPLVTTFCGEHHFGAAKNILRRAQIWGSVLTGILLTAIGIFTPQVCRLFGITDAAGLQEGTGAVRIFLLSVMLAGWNTLYSGFAQACGHEKLTYLMSVLRNLTVLLPCLILFSLPGRLSVIWWMYPVSELVSMAVWFAAVRRFNRGFLKDTPDDRILRTGCGSNPDAISQIIRQTEDFCEKWNASMKQSYYVTLTVEEICAAIMQNAFCKKNHAFEENYIEITLVAATNGDFELHLRDNAVSFNPFDMVTQQIVNADSTDGLDAIGVLMVKKKAKYFFYRRYLGFNVLVITV